MKRVYKTIKIKVVGRSLGVSSNQSLRLHYRLIGEDEYTSLGARIYGFPNSLTYENGYVQDPKVRFTAKTLDDLVTAVINHINSELPMGYGIGRTQEELAAAFEDEDEEFKQQCRENAVLDVLHTVWYKGKNGEELNLQQWKELADRVIEEIGRL